jgi:hypothetical protein
VSEMHVCGGAHLGHVRVMHVCVEVYTWGECVCVWCMCVEVHT